MLRQRSSNLVLRRLNPSFEITAKCQACDRLPVPPITTRTDARAYFAHVGFQRHCKTPHLCIHRVCMTGLTIMRFSPVNTDPGQGPVRVPHFGAE
jgi:hypothetical protein